MCFAVPTLAARAYDYTQCLLHSTTTTNAQARSGRSKPSDNRKCSATGDSKTYATCGKQESGPSREKFLIPILSSQLASLSDNLSGGKLGPYYSNQAQFDAGHHSLLEFGLSYSDLWPTGRSTPRTHTNTYCTGLKLPS